MNKLKFLLLLMLLIPVAGSAISNIVSEPIAVYEDDGWESLGEITAYGDGYLPPIPKNLSGTLYVKAIGTQTFYKFRYLTLSLKTLNFAVARSSEKEGYNAYITYDGRKYYLNLPN